MSKLPIQSEEQLLNEVATLQPDLDMGYSEDAADSHIPIVSLLQDNSGEVKKKHNKYIEGAEAGMYIIRSHHRILADGFQFVPCGFQHVWVEWPPEVGEGGPQGQHKYDRTASRDGMPSDVNKAPDPSNPDRTIWRRDNGNRLVETRYHFGLVYDDMDGTIIPAVVPFSGTGHGVSRNWTSVMRSKKLPNGSRAPAWTQIYKMASAFREKGSQSWFNMSPLFLRFVGDSELLREAQLLNRACGLGAVEAAVAEEADDAPTGDASAIS